MLKPRGLVQDVRAFQRFAKSHCRCVHLSTFLDVSTARHDPRFQSGTRTCHASRLHIFDHSRLIRVYSLIGGLLDQLNEMAQDHRRWRSLGAVDTGESGFVLAKLHEMQGGLSNGLHDLQENVGQVLEKIDKYLDR
jgi:hypothetical protein